jgi:hypothetical protein
MELQVNKDQYVQDGAPNQIPTVMIAEKLKYKSINPLHGNRHYEPSRNIKELFLEIVFREME